MDYSNYLIYGIISVSGFLFILVLILIVMLIKNKNSSIKGPDQYIHRRCPTCGQILENNWNRCPFCMEMLDKQRYSPMGGSVSDTAPIGYIAVKSGPDRGKIYKIENNTIFLGSGNQNDIIINDSHAAPQHLKIELLNNKFFIQDLRSQSGTRVNNKAIDRNELCDNDLIEAANNYFIFKILGS